MQSNFYDLIDPHTLNILFCFKAFFKIHRSGFLLVVLTKCCQVAHVRGVGEKLETDYLGNWMKETYLVSLWSHFELPYYLGRRKGYRLTLFSKLLACACIPKIITVKSQVFFLQVQSTDHLCISLLVRIKMQIPGAVPSPNESEFLGMENQ